MINSDITYRCNLTPHLKRHRYVSPVRGLCVSSVDSVSKNRQRQQTQNSAEGIYGQIDLKQLSRRSFFPTPSSGKQPMSRVSLFSWCPAHRVQNRGRAGALSVPTAHRSLGTQQKNGLDFCNTRLLTPATSLIFANSLSGQPGFE